MGADGAHELRWPGRGAERSLAGVVVLPGAEAVVAEAFFEVGDVVGGHADGGGAVDGEEVGGGLGVVACVEDVLQARV